jgi:hypothetical protein
LLSVTRRLAHLENRNTNVRVSNQSPIRVWRIWTLRNGMIRGDILAQAL